MIFAPNNSSVAWRTIPFAVFFALLALPLHHQSDGLSVSTGIFSVEKIKPKTVLPHQKDRVELASVTEWTQQRPKINPSFLRIDYKQNLLVWPNVAGDVARSPPLPAPAQSHS